jgi:carbonic anhydrase/acetyltransferase-like protein (isoleucine patch superfamily)
MPSAAAGALLPLPDCLCGRRCDRRSPACCLAAAAGRRRSWRAPSLPAADSGSISIGARTNIQDGCVIRTAGTYLHDHAADTVIGSDVTIGHQASLHGCTVEDECLIGMGATLQQGSVVEKGAMVAAGAVLAPGTTVPSGEIWGGNPAKFLRKLKAEEAKFLLASADAYVKVRRGVGPPLAHRATARARHDEQHRRRLAQRVWGVYVLCGTARCWALLMVVPLACRSARSTCRRSRRRDAHDRPASLLIVRSLSL